VHENQTSWVIPVEPEQVYCPAVPVVAAVVSKGNVPRPRITVGRLQSSPPCAIEGPARVSETSARGRARRSGILMAGRLPMGVGWARGSPRWRAQVIASRPNWVRGAPTLPEFAAGAEFRGRIPPSEVSPQASRARRPQAPYLLTRPRRRAG